MASMNPSSSDVHPSTTLALSGLKGGVKQVQKAFADQAEANHTGFQLDSSKIRPQSVANLDQINALLPSLCVNGESTTSNSITPLSPTVSPSLLADYGMPTPHKVDHALLARVNLLLNMAEQQRLAVLARPLGEPEPKVNDVEKAWIEQRQKTFVAAIEARRREMQRDEAVCKRLRKENPADDPDPEELCWEDGEFKELLDQFYGPDKPEEVGDMYESDLDEVDMIMTSPPAAELKSPVTVDEDFILGDAPEHQCANSQIKSGSGLELGHMEDLDFQNLLRDLGEVGTEPIDLDGYTIPPAHLANTQQTCGSQFPAFPDLEFTSQLEFAQEPSASIDSDNHNETHSNAPTTTSHPVNGTTQQYLAYDHSGQLVLVDGEPEAEYLAKQFPGSHVNPPSNAFTQPLIDETEPMASQSNSEGEEALRLNLNSLPTVDLSCSPSNHDFTDAEIATAMAEIEQMDFSGINTQTPMNTAEVPRGNQMATHADPFAASLVSLPGPFTRMLATSGKTGSTLYAPTTPSGAVDFPPLTEEKIYIGDKIFNSRTGKVIIPFPTHSIRQETPTNTAGMTKEILTSTHSSSSPEEFLTPTTHIYPTPRFQPHESISPATPTPKPRKAGAGRPPNTSDSVKVVDRRTPSSSLEKNVQNVFAAIGQPVRPRGRPFKVQPKEAEDSKHDDIGANSDLPKKVRARPRNVVAMGNMVDKEETEGQQRKRPANDEVGDSVAESGTGEPCAKKLKFKLGGPGGGGRYVECNSDEPEKTPSGKPRKPRTKKTKISPVNDGNETPMPSTAKTKKKRASGVLKHTKTIVDDSSTVVQGPARKKGAGRPRKTKPTNDVVASDLDISVQDIDKHQCFATEVNSVDHGALQEIASAALVGEGVVLGVGPDGKKAQGSKNDNKEDEWGGGFNGEPAHVIDA
ncbi:MAG: hypothetical protein M1836_002660 [Candelina mexicana]|nr:MAG: hypothetical protein M1836_002660 [Candelina mexicana]